VKEKWCFLTKMKFFLGGFLEKVFSAFISEGLRSIRSHGTDSAK